MAERPGAFLSRSDPQEARMRTYYRSAAVLVTDRLFTVKEGSQRAIPLNQIIRLYATTVRTQLTPRSRKPRIWLSGLAAAISLIAGTYILLAEFNVALLASAAALLASGTTLAFYPDRTPPNYELWAILTTGRHVCLFQSTDRHTFAQIQRAAARALEQHQ